MKSNNYSKANKKPVHCDYCSRENGVMTLWEVKPIKKRACPSCLKHLKKAERSLTA